MDCDAAAAAAKRETIIKDDIKGDAAASQVIHSLSLTGVSPTLVMPALGRPERKKGWKCLAAAAVMICTLFVELRLLVREFCLGQRAGGRGEERTERADERTEQTQRSGGAGAAQAGMLTKPLGMNPVNRCNSHFSVWFKTPKLSSNLIFRMTCIT